VNTSTPLPADIRREISGDGIVKRSSEFAGIAASKIALVTGGASGIGRACGLVLAREGAEAVVIADINGEQAANVVREIEATGGRASSRAVDVSDEGQVAALIGDCVERYGRLDCAINNAGISGPMGPLHEIDLQDWSRTLATNLTGVFLCMKHEIPAMQAHGAGAIVNMASGAGVIATPGLSAYCASKHAILGITKTAAVENARSGVRVNALCPGSTDTPMLQASMQASASVEKLILGSQPGGRLGRPEEIAEAAVWLCSDRASFVSGESMLVDGGAVAR
jgi:NAD(P)-dependent dehydrogenase (short-subunit alcohol dehydrogenase family)